MTLPFPSLFASSRQVQVEVIQEITAKAKANFVGMDSIIEMIMSHILSWVIGWQHQQEIIFTTEFNKFCDQTGRLKQITIGGEYQPTGVSTLLRGILG
jgi:hypothetical protein